MGKYFQAILLYSLGLDKANKLPDASDPLPTKKQLFSQDVTLMNHAACFFKLGDEEKAEADLKKASYMNPKKVKAIFRHGLAFHAMK
jgi:tetratricopeptide (TPR) repeat protein